MRWILLLPVLCAPFLFAAADPWTPGNLLRPVELASELKAGSPPAMWMVGPRLLYNGNHIAGAKFAGPASHAEGIDKLLAGVAQTPKDARIVIYCGCCPMEKCPNIRPAYSALQKAGFTNVRVLDIPTNLPTDWTEKGFPVERGAVEK